MKEVIRQAISEAVGREFKFRGSTKDCHLFNTETNNNGHYLLFVAQIDDVAVCCLTEMDCEDEVYDGRLFDVAKYVDNIRAKGHNL